MMKTPLVGKIGYESRARTNGRARVKIEINYREEVTSVFVAVMVDITLYSY